jgi:hypothetical protein
VEGGQMKKRDRQEIVLVAVLFVLVMAFSAWTEAYGAKLKKRLKIPKPGTKVCLEAVGRDDGAYHDLLMFWERTRRYKNGRQVLTAKGRGLEFVVLFPGMARMADQYGGQWLMGKVMIAKGAKIHKSLGLQFSKFQVIHFKQVRFRKKPPGLSCWVRF